MSFLVSFLAVTWGAAVGIFAGSVASMSNSGFGEAISRVGDFIFAFPVLVVAILFRQSLGGGMMPIILAIGLYNVAIFTRTTYGSAFPLWRRDYVLAARVAGKNRLMIAFQHILPNISGVLIVQVTLQFSMGILSEAALSWLGVGIQPPVPSLGRMLMESTTYYWVAPQLVLLPACLIVLIVLSLNRIGDRLSDYLDPKRTGGRP
jgi:peptide/nickel transport system permease protein